MTLNDLELQKGFCWIFRNFWLQRTWWTATKCRKIDQDNLRTKFSALNTDFISPSADSLGSRRPAHLSVKSGYPSKSGYFTDIGSSSIKTVADRHRHPAYHNKHYSDELLRGVNIDDFEWPWSPKIVVLVIFFTILGCDAHFKGEFRRNGWR